MEARNLTCVDLAEAAWRKSSHSGNNGATCVEVAGNLPGFVAVRDSKNPTGPALAFTPDAWRTFLQQVKSGMFDKTA
ncbi:DUF397 domain-containing protein [Thermopolyspora sp. NPDC052614]|uniref:DUF397 domain-containing protein n=1 Tax=Thermopolyspora sp. NPDC052614 TaxID=3155682 RepID=UPI00343BC4BF